MMMCKNIINWCQMEKMRGTRFSTTLKEDNNMKIQVVVVLRCTGTRQSKQDLHTHTLARVAHAHTHIIIID